MKNASEIALEFMSRGGKRLRPQILAAAYRRLCPHGQADLTPLTEAVECFHKASLIHDDIQDGDTVRYGHPAVWCEYGVPLAIAAGDWLLAYGISLIDNAGFPNGREMSALRSKALLELCEGQGEELSGCGDYVSVCTKKTGSLFALAAGLGALAAGARPDPFWEWGVVYGVLFQIRDDLRDRGDDSALHALKLEYAARLEALADRVVL